MLTGILGAFRAGLVAVPGLHDVHRRRARQDHGRLRRPRRARDPGVRRRGRRGGRRVAPTSSTPCSPATAVARRARRASPVHTWDDLPTPAGRRGDPRDRADRRRLLGAVALHLRHDRAAQGGDAPARQHPPRLRDLRRPGARHHARRHRPSRWRRCSSPTASATRCSSRSRSARPPCSSRAGRRPDVVRERLEQTRPTLFFGVPTFYAALLRQRPARRRLRLGAAVRVGGRAAAGAAAEAVHRPLRRRDPRRHRLHRGAAHLPVQPARRHPPRHHRRRRCPATTSSPRRRTAQPVGRRRAGRAARARRVDRAGLLAPHRRHPAGLPGRVAGHRRHLRPQRRGLLHLPGPQQRHAQGRRHLGLARRGGEPAARAPRRPRGRRGRASPTPTASTSRSPWSSSGDGVDEDELVAWCRDGLAHFKAPRQVVFVDDLPKTATGKLQRFKVRGLVARRPGGRAGDHGRPGSHGGDLVTEVDLLDRRRRTGRALRRLLRRRPRPLASRVVDSLSQLGGQVTRDVPREADLRHRRPPRGLAAATWSAGSWPRRRSTRPDVPARPGGPATSRTARRRPLGS